MSGFHPKDLIKEVKIRPGIYNRDELFQPTREHKRRLWLEVAERLTPEEDWQVYTDVEKEARVDEIATKWKHMKDHFHREIKLQDAGEANKKRKYVYFDDMEFMRPFVGYKMLSASKRKNKSIDESTDNNSQNAESDSEVDLNAYLRAINSDEAEVDSHNNSSVQEECPQGKSAIKPITNTLENKSMHKNLNAAKKKTEPTSPTFKVRDGDISFSLSLVPSLRKLGDSRKISAKIEILKILHRYVDHIERVNAKRNHKIPDNNEMDEDHLEETDEFINIKHEQQHDDPLTGNSSSSSNSKTWWT